MRDFEPHCVDKELLLDWDEGVEEETGLGPDVCEGGGDGSYEVSSDGSPWSGKEAVAYCLVGFLGVAAVKGIWRIGCYVDGDVVLSCAISVVVVDWYVRAVDRKLFVVWSAVTIELSVEV